MSIFRADVTIHSRVRAAASALGPSEGRVAAVIMDRPDDVVDWSAAELAAAAGTSTATVIRACQSLGFRGFQHLRLELARSVPPMTNANGLRKPTCLANISPLFAGEKASSWAWRS